MTHNKVSRRAFAATAGTIATTGLAGCTGTILNSGSTYPSETIELWVGFPKGASIDLESRILASIMQDELDVSVTVENVSGAVGSVAANRLANSADADGYTIGMYFAPHLSLIPKVLQDTDYNYDALEDFTYIAETSRGAGAIRGSTENGINSLEDLKAAGENGDTITYSLPGPDPMLVPMHQLADAYGFDLEIVFTPPGGKTEAALQSGRIDVTAATLSKAIEKKVTSDYSSIPMIFSEPDVFADYYTEEYDITLNPDQFVTNHTDLFEEVYLQTMSNGIFAPADIPDEVVTTIYDAIQSSSDAYHEQAKSTYDRPMVNDGETAKSQTETYINDIEGWIPRIKELAARYQ